MATNSEAGNMPKTCAWPTCDKPVISRQSRAKYCSKVCSNKANHEQKVVRLGRGRQHRECPVCAADMTYAHRSAFWCPNCKPDNHHDRVNREQEARDIAIAREGMRPLKPGKVTCQCGAIFDSWDVTRNRMCDRCLGKAETLNNGALEERTGKW